MVWQEKRVINLFVVNCKEEVMRMCWWLTVRAEGITLMYYKCCSGFKLIFECSRSRIHCINIINQRKQYHCVLKHNIHHYFEFVYSSLIRICITRNLYNSPHSSNLGAMADGNVCWERNCVLYMVDALAG